MKIKFWRERRAYKQQLPQSDVAFAWEGVGGLRGKKTKIML
jgi:hypothetical protein